MAEKGGPAGAAPAVDDPGNIRNVVLVGHSGSGKSTVASLIAGRRIELCRCESRPARNRVTIKECSPDIAIAEVCSAQCRRAKPSPKGPV